METGKYSPHFQYDGWGTANGTFGRNCIWFRFSGLRGMGKVTGLDKESNVTRTLVVPTFAKPAKVGHPPTRFVP